MLRHVDMSPGRRRAPALFPALVGASMALRVTSALGAGGPSTPSIPRAEEARPTVGALTDGAVYVGCGWVVAHNAAKGGIQLLLAGKDVRHLDDPALSNAFVVDNVVVEVRFAPAEQVADRDVYAPLRRHMRSELAFVTEHLGAVVPSEARELKVGQRPVLFWDYALPKPVKVLGESVVKVMYGTIVIRGEVVVLAAPRRPDDLDVVAVGVLARALATATEVPTRIDVAALARQTRQGVPWEGCRGVATKGSLERAVPTTLPPERATR